MTAEAVNRSPLLCLPAAPPEREQQEPEAGEEY
jgi:hypothetical protein